MELELNSILNLSDDDLKNSKIELNISAGKYGEKYIDVWLALDEDAKKVVRTIFLIGHGMVNIIISMKVNLCSVLLKNHITNGCLFLQVKFYLYLLMTALKLKF